MEPSMSGGVVGFALPKNLFGSLCLRVPALNPLIFGREISLFLAAAIALRRTFESVFVELSVPFYRSECTLTIDVRFSLEYFYV